MGMSVESTDPSMAISKHVSCGGGGGGSEEEEGMHDSAAGSEGEEAECRRAIEAAEPPTLWVRHCSRLVSRLVSRLARSASFSSWSSCLRILSSLYSDTDRMEEECG